MLETVITLELHLRQNRKKATKQLEEERKLYTAQILRAQETERKHISQELHDGIAQELLVLVNEADEQVSYLNDLGMDVNHRDVQKLKGKVEWMRNKIYSLCKDIRRLSIDLGPTILEELGLLPSITWLADRLHSETGIKTEVVATGSVQRLTDEIATGIFRIVQECLNNVRRHSQATEVKIDVMYTTNDLIIRVEDNGVGFVIPEKYSDLTSSGRLGLMNILVNHKDYCPGWGC